MFEVVLEAVVEHADFGEKLAVVQMGVARGGEGRREATSGGLSRRILARATHREGVARGRRRGGESPIREPRLTPARLARRDLKARAEGVLHRAARDRSPGTARASRADARALARERVRGRRAACANEGARAVARARGGCGDPATRGAVPWKARDR